MITTSEKIDEISKALVAAEAEIGGALKDAKNPHFKSQYASLASIVAASKVALAGQEIGVIQSPGTLNDGALRIITRLIHSSGQWIETTCDIPLGKKDAQGVGSTTTYGRRYALAAALNIPVVDDDAESAVLRGEEPANEAAPAKKAPPPKQTPHPAKEDMLDWGDVLPADDQHGNMHAVGVYNKGDSRKVFVALQEVMQDAATMAELLHWALENQVEIWKLNGSARHFLRERFDSLTNQFEQQSEAA